MSYATEKQLKQVVEKIENKKASKTGVYPKLVAGNLIDTKADATPRVFTFDSSCGDASISDDGSATIKLLKGNTNVFNQMVEDSKYVDETGDGVTSMAVPEHTVSDKFTKLSKLGGHIEKDDTLTARAGVVGETIVHEGNLSSPKFNEISLVGNKNSGTDIVVANSIVSKMKLFALDGTGQIIIDKEDGLQITFVYEGVLFLNYTNNKILHDKYGIDIKINGNSTSFEYNDRIYENDIITFSKPVKIKETMWGNSGFYNLTDYQTLTLPEQTLNGQDEIYSYVEGNELVVKKITRYGSVDLGTLNWYATQTINNLWRFATSGVSTLAKPVATNDNKPNVVCSKYNAKTPAQTYLEEEGITINQSSYINIYDDSFKNNDNASAFKTAMSGVMLVYELAQPTITEIARVPLTCDFQQVENVITNNVEFATETQNVQKGVVVASMTEKVDVYGENLFNHDEFKTTNIGMYNTYISNYNEATQTITTTTENGLPSLFNMLLPAGTYTIKAIIESGSISYIRTNLSENVYLYETFTLTERQTVELKIRTIGNVCKFKLMLVKGNVAPETYKPYREPQTYLLSQLAQIKERVGDITLGYINFDRKVFVKDMSKLVLNGSENWQRTAKNTTDKGYFFYLDNVGIKLATSGTDIVDIKVDSPYIALSPNGIYGGTEDGVGAWSSNNRLCLYDNNTKNMSIADFKNWLSIQNIVVYIPLATPQEIDISDLLTDDDKYIEVEAGGTVEFTAKTNPSIDWNKDQYTLSLVSSHKYLHKDRINGTNTIKTGLSTLVVNSGPDGSGDNLINLTRMFGAGKEPATFDDLCYIYPKLRGNVPYDAGKMVNYKGTDIKTVGFNQIDISHFVKGRVDDGNIGYDGDTEELIISDNSIYFKVKEGWRGCVSDIVKVLPNTQYYVNYTFDSQLPLALYVTQYDDNKHYIDKTPIANYFTTSSNAYYIRISFEKKTAGSMTISNICMNLSWSGYRNGEYEPHWEYTLDLSNVTKIQNHATKAYIRSGSVDFSDEWLSLTADGEALTPATGKAYKIVSQGDYLDKIFFWNGSVYEEDTTRRNLLFPEGLLSAGNVSDEVYADHAVKRVGRMKIKDWKNVSIVLCKDSIGHYFSGHLTDALPKLDNNNNCRNTSTNVNLPERNDYGYPSYHGWDLAWLRYNIIAISADSLYIYNDDLRDATVAELKEWLGDDAEIYYELAEPIVVTFDDNEETGSANQLAPLDMSYRVADFSTEESLPESNNVVPEFAPLVADVIYSNDITRQIVNMAKYSPASAGTPGQVWSATEDGGQWIDAPQGGGSSGGEIHLYRHDIWIRIAPSTGYIYTSIINQSPDLLNTYDAIKNFLKTNNYGDNYEVVSAGLPVSGTLLISNTLYNVMAFGYSYMRNCIVFIYATNNITTINTQNLSATSFNYVVDKVTQIL